MPLSRKKRQEQAPSGGRPPVTAPDRRFDQPAGPQSFATGLERKWEEAWYRARSADVR